jgi:hypothetical protein
MGSWCRWAASQSRRSRIASARPPVAELLERAIPGIVGERPGAFVDSIRAVSSPSGG